MFIKLLKIEVTDNGRGELSASVLVIDSDDIPRDSIAFYNIYNDSYNPKMSDSSIAWLLAAGVSFGALTFTKLRRKNDE